MSKKRKLDDVDMDDVAEAAKKTKEEAEAAVDPDLKIEEFSSSQSSAETSQDMFASTQDDEKQPEAKKVEKDKDSDGDDGMSPSWRGVPLAALNVYRKMVPPKSSSSSVPETVLVQWPPKKAEDGASASLVPLRPPPEAATEPREFWDEAHVRMPFSEQSVFPVEVEGGGGRKELKKRWRLICEAISSSRIMSSEDFEQRVLSYNNKRWRFAGFHEYVEEELSDSEQEYRALFESVLPEVAHLVVTSPHRLTRPVPLLRAGQSGRLTFSQTQLASILANAFFCTYPRRNSQARNSEFANYPEINFNRLFGDLGEPYQNEKLKCIFNYFRLISKRDFESGQQEGLVSFERRRVPRSRLPDWAASVRPVPPDVHVDAAGTIEDDGLAMLQVDFANAFVGGGVLGHGCVQEEIRFLISPELIASKLFTERLEDNECLIMTGFERFSNYSGYAKDFRFTGPRRDDTPLDPDSLHRVSRLVAIDAIAFRNSRDQYTAANIRRELDKAYVGFHSEDEVRSGNSAPAAVATGNWGCGAFGGDPQLKSLIQLLAAAECGRDLCYFTFGDRRLRDGLAEVSDAMAARPGVTVGEIYKMLCSYGRIRGAAGSSVFDHVLSMLSYGVDTDDDDLATAEEEEEEPVSNGGGKSKSPSPRPPSREQQQQLDSDARQSPKKKRESGLEAMVREATATSGRRSTSPPPTSTKKDAKITDFFSKKK